MSGLAFIVYYSLNLSCYLKVIKIKLSTNIGIIHECHVCMDQSFRRVTVHIRGSGWGIMIND